MSAFRVKRRCYRLFFYKFILLVLLASLFISNPTLATSVKTYTSEDLKRWIEALKEAGVNTVASYQDRINTNKDGTLREFTPDLFGEEAENHFDYIYLSYISSKSLQKGGNFTPREVCNILSALHTIMRSVVSRYQDIINHDKDGEFIYKGFDAQTFGRLTSEIFYKKTGISIKLTSLGKGEYGVRYGANKPDDWEREVLKKLAKAKYRGKVIGETIEIGDKEVYRYMKSIYITKSCLPCHGKPAGEEDVAGYKKEGYENGGFRGGVSVILPLKTGPGITSK